MVRTTAFKAKAVVYWCDRIAPSSVEGEGDEGVGQPWGIEGLWDDYGPGEGLDDRGSGAEDGYNGTVRSKNRGLDWEESSEVFPTFEVVGRGTTVKDYGVGNSGIDAE